MARRRAGESKVAVGNIREVSGEVNIAAGDIYKGFTAEQVSALLKQIISTFQPKKFDGRCPYKGLDVFEEEDAELFFGREKLIDDLVSRVKESRTVFITGPSGSGKSSLVRAGLIHDLKQGATKNSKSWLYETIKPGRDPIEALALVFSRLKSPELANYFREHINESNILHECAESVLSGRKDQRLVLFIDQFEEVFTQVGKEKAEEFIDILTTAATVENGRVILLFSMRSDFVSNCATYPQLNALLNQQFIQIGAMQPGELVSAIAQPALRVGLRIDPDLIAQIINEMEGEPGVLPLMQFALKDLFDSQQTKGGIIALTLNDYLQRGGIHKALERHADDSFAKLDKNEQELARSIFSGLIEIGRGTQDTRRTALFDELIPANTKAEDVEDIVQKLADARLITTDERAGKDTVALAHEKLIDAWPWLKKLVNENRDVIALQNEIASDAKEWVEHKRDSSYLYTGARLVNAREQLESKRLVLSGTAYDFVKAGRARQRRSQLTLIVGVSIIMVVLVFAVIVFSRQSTINAEIAIIAQTAEAHAINAEAIAKANEKFARAGELAALSNSERDNHFDLSLLFAVEGYKKLDNYRTRESLFSAIDSHQGLIRYIPGHKNPIVAVSYSPNGKMLVSVDERNAILWDISNPDSLTQLATFPRQSDYLNVYFTGAVFSPDSKMLVLVESLSGFSEDSARSSITLWDLSNPNSPSLLNYLLPGRGFLHGIAFAPNGKILASGWDNNIILWDVANPNNPLNQSSLSTNGQVSNVAFSQNGKILASVSCRKTEESNIDNCIESEITLWDIASNKQFTVPFIIGTNINISSIAFSLDNKTLATASDKNIVLWDTSDPSHPLQRTTPLEDDSTVSSLAFSSDGKMLASGHTNNTISAWNVSNLDVALQSDTLSGHSGPVSSVAFSPDGKTLVSGGKDRFIILWDISRFIKPSQRAILLGTGGISSIAINSSGKILASASEGVSTLWDLSNLGKPFKITNILDSVYVTFSPNGKILASASDIKPFTLWDIDDPGKPSKIATLPIYTQFFAFIPKTNMLASLDYNNQVHLWNLSNASNPLEYSSFCLSNGCTFELSAMAFSLDGKFLAIGENDRDEANITGVLLGTISLWDISDPQKPTKLTTFSGYVNPPVSSIAFAPHSKILASSTNDGNITLWDISNLNAPIQRAILVGFGGSISNVIFSQDGKILASSGSDDNTITLWDVSNPDSPAKIASLSGHSQPIPSMAFTPDGKILVSASQDSRIILWDIDPNSWIEKACQRVGRNFTRAEWAQYFPNEPYPTKPEEATCPQWPLEPETAPTVSPTP